MDANTPIKLDLTLNEVEGILAGLGELPTKTGAFPLLMKIKIQTEAQLPKEEPKVADVKPEDIKAA